MARRRSYRFKLKIPRARAVRPDPKYRRLVFAAFKFALSDLIEVRLPAAMAAYEQGGEPALAAFIASTAASRGVT